MFGEYVILEILGIQEYSFLFWAILPVIITVDILSILIGFSDKFLLCNSEQEMEIINQSYIFININK